MPGHDHPPRRPLSTVELLTSERGGQPARASLHDAGGLENGAFELGSPLSPPPTMETDHGNQGVEENNNNNNNNNNNITEACQHLEEASTSFRDENINTSTTTAIMHSDIQRTSRDGNSVSKTNGKFECQMNRKSLENPRISRHVRHTRPSWLLDGYTRRRDDAEMRMRRKTDPSGEAMGSYSYRQDCQEALSSLLWQPYDCRDHGNQTGATADDADVALWLYAPMRQGRPGSDVAAYGFRSSFSSSTSSMSSSSSSAALGAAAAIMEDGHVWRNKEVSPSSLQDASIGEDHSSSEGVRMLALDGRRNCKIGNVSGDPNQHVEEVLDVVSDLHKPWAGTITAAVEVLPVGALPSSCTGGDCDLCCSACAPQCEKGCDEVHVAEGECCLCCDRDVVGKMLVNVKTSTLDTGGGQSACANGVNDEEELSSLVPSTPAIGIVSAVTSNISTFTSSTTNVGSSVSVVNCYRAVPVVVSAVPAISCLNASLDNVCNVHIVQTTTPSECVPVRPQPTVGRTFTSTEAQTDDIGVDVAVLPTSPIRSGASNNREQRRRERRERRHQRRLNSNLHHNSLNGPPPHPHHDALWQTQVVEPVHERLPDILNSHLPPPYSTLPLGLPQAVQPAPQPPPPVPPSVPMHVSVPSAAATPPHPGGMRFPFQITPTGRRRSRRVLRGQHYTPEEEPKSCCGVVVTQTVSIRWFIVMIAFVGICCAVVGTVLGAMKASGKEHLTVSLLMIGVGIVLITVSGVAWRLTAHDAPSCRMMLGLGGGEESGTESNRRFVPRLPPSYGRPHHPYAAMMYPEFQYRPPPPSYQASMQEYRLRLLLLDRHPSNSTPSPGQAPSGHMVSPPPTYRSHAGSTLRAPLGLRRDQLQSDYSRPPSYRSRTSSAQPTLDQNGNTGCSTAEHSSDPSLSLSESGGGSAVVNVISVMSNGRNERGPLDSIKLVPGPDQEVPLRMMLNKGSHSGNMGIRNGVEGAKDGNIVTIVQTGNDTNPVIVTVSGSTMATTTMGSSTSRNGMDTEMEILAHL